MVKIRLRRMGAKAQPTYRIVASDKESPRDGRFLEILGSYNPRTVPATIQVNEDRVYHWMSQGAQPSESVVQLFRSTGLLDRYARFKQGEALETLLAEASATAAATPASPKTSAGKPSNE
jgi:small subunit ribosomal protein S16